MKQIDIQIGTDPTISYCWTRNGSPKLVGLEVWTTDPQPDATVFIEGVGTRGTFTKSGVPHQLKRHDRLVQGVARRGGRMTDKQWGYPKNQPRPWVAVYHRCVVCGVLVRDDCMGDHDYRGHKLNCESRHVN